MGIIVVYPDKITDDEERVPFEHFRSALEMERPRKIFFDGAEFTQFAADAMRVVMAYNNKHGNMPETGISMEARSDAIAYGIDQFVTGSLAAAHVH